MDETAFEAYLDQWSGDLGQRLYLQKDAQLDEDDTGAFEPLLPSIEVPVRIVWGEHDAWLPPTTAERLSETIPNSDLRVLPGAGHFAMEDSPDEVAAALEEFFAAGAPVTGLPRS